MGGKIGSHLVVVDWSTRSERSLLEDADRLVVVVLMGGEAAEVVPMVVALMADVDRLVVDRMVEVVEPQVEAGAQAGVVSQNSAVHAA